VWYFSIVADWEERYKRGEHTNEEPHPLLLQYVSDSSPGRALDVACGAGRHAIWLATRDWQVDAVDYSPTAIGILRKRSSEKGLHINTYIADLEHREFEIEAAAYDLVVVCNYLQRDLFESIKAGTRIGGMIVASIAMVDDDPNIKPMNPAFLVDPGELRSHFERWELLHDFEGKPGGDPNRRATAELVARRVKGLL
jgi:tellurite methyltransferase